LLPNLHGTHSNNPPKPSRLTAFPQLGGDEGGRGIKSRAGGDLHPEFTVSPTSKQFANGEDVRRVNEGLDSRRLYNNYYPKVRSKPPVNFKVGSKPVHKSLPEMNMGGHHGHRSHAGHPDGREGRHTIGQQRNKDIFHSKIETPYMGPGTLGGGVYKKKKKHPNPTPLLFQPNRQSNVYGDTRQYGNKNNLHGFQSRFGALSKDGPGGGGMGTFGSHNREKPGMQFEVVGNERGTFSSHGLKPMGGNPYYKPLKRRSKR
jgi:hypothetical protein